MYKFSIPIEIIPHFGIEYYIVLNNLWSISKYGRNIQQNQEGLQRLCTQNCKFGKVADPLTYAGSKNANENRDYERKGREPMNPEDI